MKYKVSLIMTTKSPTVYDTEIESFQRILSKVLSQIKLQADHI